MPKHPLSNLWRKMKARCQNPKDREFFRYGARGITVCDRWANSFQAFVEDVGPRPSPKHSIDRIDGAKGYSPDNCRWATAQEQSLNRPEWVVILEHQGRRQTVVEWARELGIGPSTLYNRVRMGWPPDRALQERPGTRRVNSRMLTVGGRTQTLPAWAREAGLRPKTVKERLRRGWTPEEALSPEMEHGRSRLARLRRESRREA